MQAKDRFFLIKIPPSAQLLSVLIVFFIIPPIIILNFDIVHWRYDTGAQSFQDSMQKYLYINILFVVVFLISSFSISGRVYKSFKLRSTQITKLDIPKWFFNSKSKLIFPIILISSIVIYLFWANGGYFYIQNLGAADVSGREFRFHGFDNIPRIYSQLLNLARRIFLPIGIVCMTISCILSDWRSRSDKIILLLLLVLQIFASSLTFARFPFMVGLFSLLLPFLLIYKKGLGQKYKPFRVVAFVSIAILSILLLSGLVSNLQYNNTDFNILEVIGSGFTFLIFRAYLVPSMVPITYSIVPFPDTHNFLSLEHSRLYSLIAGNDIVGTSDAFSFFVTPVGITGDIWRNFGFIGIIVIGYILGMLFSYLDVLVQKLNVIRFLLFQICLFFLFTYWTFGVFFSQGSVFVMIMTTLTAFKIKVPNKI